MHPPDKHDLFDMFSSWSSAVKRVLKNFIQYLLNKYLKDYIERLDDVQIKVSLKQGQWSKQSASSNGWQVDLFDRTYLLGESSINGEKVEPLPTRSVGWEWGGKCRGWRNGFSRTSSLPSECRMWLFKFEMFTYSDEMKSPSILGHPFSSGLTFQSLEIPVSHLFLSHSILSRLEREIQQAEAVPDLWGVWTNIVHCWSKSKKWMPKLIITVIEWPVSTRFFSLLRNMPHLRDLGWSIEHRVDRGDQWQQFISAYLPKLQSLFLPWPSAKTLSNRSNPWMALITSSWSTFDQLFRNTPQSVKPFIHRTTARLRHSHHSWLIELTLSTFDPEAISQFHLPVLDMSHSEKMTCTKESELAPHSPCRAQVSRINRPTRTIDRTFVHHDTIRAITERSVPRDLRVLRWYWPARWVPAISTRAPVRFSTNDLSSTVSASVERWSVASTCSVNSIYLISARASPYSSSSAVSPLLTLSISSSRTFDLSLAFVHYWSPTFILSQRKRNDSIICRPWSVSHTFTCNSIKPWIRTRSTGSCWPMPCGACPISLDTISSNASPINQRSSLSRQLFRHRCGTSPRSGASFNGSCSANFSNIRQICEFCEHGWLSHTTTTISLHRPRSSPWPNSPSRSSTGRAWRSSFPSCKTPLICATWTSIYSRCWSMATIGRRSSTTFLLKLKTFELSMKGSFDTEDEVEQLIDTFRSPFWTTKRRFFVRCFAQGRALHLQTKSKWNSYSQKSFPRLFKSTYPQDDFAKLSEQLTSVYETTFLRLSLSRQCSLLTSSHPWHWSFPSPSTSGRSCGASRNWRACRSLHTRISSPNMLL